MEKKVIIKKLTAKQPKLESIANLQLEVKILEKLEGTGVPKIVELLSHENNPVLITRDFEGRSLDLILKNQKI